MADRSLRGTSWLLLVRVRHGTVELSRAAASADSLAAANRQSLIDIDDVHTLAQGIVDTIQVPLLVLDQHLRVVTANRAFCQMFRMNSSKH